MAGNPFDDLIPRPGPVQNAPVDAGVAPDVTPGTTIVPGTAERYPDIPSSLGSSARQPMPGTLVFGQDIKPALPPMPPTPQAQPRTPTSMFEKLGVPQFGAGVGGGYEAIGQGLQQLAEGPTVPATVEKSDIFQNTPSRLGTMRQAGTGVADTGRAIADYGKGIREAQPPMAVKSYEDIKSFGDLGTYIWESVQQAAGSTVPMLAAGAVAGPAGAVGAGWTMGVGQMRRSVEEERIKVDRAAQAAIASGNTDEAARLSAIASRLDPRTQAQVIYATGSVIGALDSLFPATMFAKSAEAEIVKKLTAEYVTKAIAAAAMRGAATEGVTEALQQGAEVLGIAKAKGAQAAAEYAKALNDNTVEIIDSGLRGAIGGGGMSGAGKAGSLAGERERGQPQPTPEAPNQPQERQEPQLSWPVAQNVETPPAVTPEAQGSSRSDVDELRRRASLMTSSNDQLGNRPVEPEPAAASNPFADLVPSNENQQRPERVSTVADAIEPDQQPAQAVKQPDNSGNEIAPGIFATPTTSKIDDRTRYEITNANGDVIGNATVGDSQGRFSVKDVRIAPQYQRQGVATALYDRIERDFGRKLQEDNSQTDASRAFWDDRAGRRPIRTAESDDILAAIQSAPSRIEYEVRTLLNDARNYEDFLVNEGATPQQIADAFNKRYGSAVTAEQIEGGNVWWRRMTGERESSYSVSDGFHEGVLPAGEAARLIEQTISESPLLDGVAASMDVDAKPASPQQVRGVSGGSSPGPRLTAEQREAAVALAQQGISSRQIASQLQQQYGTYVRTDLVDAVIADAKAETERSKSTARATAKRRAYYDSPEFRESSAARMREMMARPEMKAWASERMRAMHASPEFKAGAAERGRKSAEARGLTLWSPAMIERLGQADTRAMTAQEVVDAFKAEFGNVAAKLTANAIRQKRSDLGYGATVAGTSPFSPKIEKRLSDPDIRSLQAAPALAKLKAEFGAEATSRITPTTITNKRAGNPKIAYTGKTTNPTGFQWSAREDGRDPNTRLAELMTEAANATERATILNKEFGGPGIPALSPKAVSKRWDKIKDSVLRSQGEEPMFAAGGWDWKTLKAWWEENSDVGREDATAGSGTSQAGSGQASGQQPGTAEGGSNSNEAAANGGADGVRQSFKVRDFLGRVVDAPPNSFGLRQQYVFLHPPKITWPFTNSAKTTLKNLEHGVPNWMAKAHVSEGEPGVWQVMNFKIRKNQAENGLTPEFLDALQSELGDIRPPDQMTPEAYNAWRAWERQGSRWSNTSIDGYVEHKGLFYSPDFLRDMQAAAADLAKSAPSAAERNTARREFNELSDLVDKLPPEDDILAAIQGNIYNFPANNVRRSADKMRELELPLLKALRDEANSAELLRVSSGLLSRIRDEYGFSVMQDGLPTNPAELGNGLLAISRGLRSASEGLQLDKPWPHFQVYFTQSGALRRFEDGYSGNTGIKFPLTSTPDDFANFVRKEGILRGQPETLAAIQSSTPSLDLSPEARKERAEEMGFDTSRVWYQSQLQPKTEFKPHGKFMGRWGVSGISLTDNPEMASRYLDRYGDMGWVDGKPYQPFQKAVGAYYVKRGNYKTITKPIAQKLMLGAPLPEGYTWPAELDGYDGVIVTDAINGKGKSVGHVDPSKKGAVVGQELILRDPANIRSVNATFDPSLEASADLMAAVNAEPKRNPAAFALMAVTRLKRPVVIPKNVVDGILDALQPSMGMVPEGVNVGVLERVAPFKGEGKADSLLTFRLTDGELLEIPAVAADVLTARAFTMPASGFIGFNRFDLSGDPSRSLRGEVGHEVVHILRRQNAIKAADWSRLVAQGNALSLLDSDYRTHLQRVGNPNYSTVAPGLTGREVYETRYGKSRNKAEYMDQEAVAHMVELYAHNELFPQEVEGIKPLLDAILDGSIWRIPQEGEVQQGELELMGAAQGSAAPSNMELQREKAEAEGFNTDVQYWHGTGRDLTETGFDLRKAQDKEGRRRGVGLGKGKVYLDANREGGNSWAMAAKDRGLGDKPNVVGPLWVRGPLIDENDYKAEFERISGGRPITDSTLDMAERDRLIAATDKAVKAQGYKGIQTVYRNRDGSVAELGQTAMFNTSDIRHVNADFDPDRSGSSDLMAAAQKGKTRLAALHNLSAENLAFADKMGGIGAPSIAVVKEGMGIEDGAFGDITLIGRKDLGDPSKNPVFDADAWTTRFPRAEYKAVPSGKAQKFVDALRPYAAKFNDTMPMHAAWDDMVNKPDTERAVQGLLRSEGAQAMFLDKVKGQQPAPVMRAATESMRNPWVAMPAFQAYAARHGGFDNGLRSDDAAGWAELSKAVSDAVDEFVAIQGDPTKMEQEDYDHFRSLYRDELFDENGQLFFGKTQWINDDLRKVGKQEVDKTKSRELMEQAIKPYESEFKSWVENQIVPLYGEPRIKVGGKYQPYTLENIVQFMTGKRSIKAQEAHMTFGPGKARADAAHRMKSLEDARSRADWQMGDSADVTAARERANKLLEDWRNAVVPHNKYVRANAGQRNAFGSTWEALDGAMRAMATWAKGKKTPEAMRSALAREDFTEVPADVLELGVEAGKAFLEAPVPYFESKPQRAVGLNEFAGAVVPADADPATLAILDKHGIPYQTYDKTSPKAQAEAAAKFTQDLARQGQDTLFAFAGINARTADKEALALAEKMEKEGTPREDIWRDTGWFRGVDGKWRFEIDDSGSRYTHGDDRVTEFLMRRGGGKPSTAPTYEPGTLGANVKHDKLYEAYPDMPGMALFSEGSGLENARGVYDAGDPRKAWHTEGIGINENTSDKRSTALHEMQHAIQEREDFGRGGNPESMTGDIAQARNTETELRQKMTTFQNRAFDEARFVMAKASQGDPSAKEFADASWAKWSEKLGEQSEDNPYGIDRQGAISAELLDQDQIYQRLAMEYNKAFRVARDDPYARYRKLAGEAESRTVQKRRNATPEERRARPPWLDYDIPESEQIVRFGNTGPSHSFGTVLSPEANIPAYTQAVVMSKRGDDPKTIWDATGWFKDKTGKWRFEKEQPDGIQSVADSRTHVRRMEMTPEERKATPPWMEPSPTRASRSSGGSVTVDRSLIDRALNLARRAKKH